MHCLSKNRVLNGQSLVIRNALSKPDTTKYSGLLVNMIWLLAIHNPASALWPS